MRKKRTAILLAVALLCVGILLGRVAVHKFLIWRIEVPGDVAMLGIHLVEDTVFLQDKEKLTPSDNSMVGFEGVLLPYDSGSNTLYLSQSAGEWSGKLSVETETPYVLCGMKADAYWNQLDFAIRQGHLFTLYVVSETEYYEYNMVVSGMPVISMSTERIEEQEEVSYEEDPDKKYFGSETLHYGSIQVFNPGVGTDTYQVLQSRVCYHFKGASTASFEKKSYSLELQNAREQNLDVSLLGMRADSSWKLNALNTDVNRIREITAAQIWEEIDGADTAVEEPGPVLEYVELVVDNDYKGLYCLVEPVDDKKLNLDKNDVLYKMIDWYTEWNDEDIQSSIDNKWKIQYPIRVRYPKVITDYEKAWFPIREYLSIFYSGAPIDYNVAVAKINLDNYMDYAIFTMAVAASDNCFKNTYYAAHVNADGSYQMIQSPWDLDYTFGNEYAYGAINNVFFNESNVVYMESALQGLHLANPNGFGAELYERWKNYRETFLSTDSILQRMEKNRDYIMETGAVNREMQRWPDAQVDMNIDGLIQYQTERMAWLDEYFLTWTGIE